MTDATLTTRTVLLRSVSNWSSGAFAATVCWVSGISLVATAVLFSVGGAAPTRVFGMMGLAVGSLMCGLARTASPWLRLRIAGMLISSVTILVISEVAMRVFTHFPINGSSNMVPHNQLGYVLDPEMPDADANGFRNPDVIDQASIVTIGDSHTQGVNASLAGSWPQQLSKQLNTSVYNLGVGGYGPLHYKVLLDKALKLKPQLVVIGLYLGNDLGDVVRGIQPRHTIKEVDNSFRHTLKYHTAIGSALSQAWGKSRVGRPSGFEISHTMNPTYVSHRRIQQHAEDMDVTDPKVEAAFGETIRILTDAHSRCQQQGVKLLVMLIPTRESVYAAAGKSAEGGPFYTASAGPEAETPGVDDHDEFHQLAKRETTLRTHLTAVLAERSISFIDILPDLTTAVLATPNVYPDYDEGHPLANGYAVYANAVARTVGASRAGASNQ